MNNRLNLLRTDRSILTVMMVCAAAGFSGLSGCSTAPAMVSAPNLYVDAPDARPFAEVPAALQTTAATVLYATDRGPETIDGEFAYGIVRSRAMTYGLCTVQMGKPGTTWEELVTASTTRPAKAVTMPLTLTGIDMRGSFPAVAAAVKEGDRWVDAPEYLEEVAAAQREVCELVSERLALTPRKEVFVFVHGYNNSFASGAFRAAQLWHYTGRGGLAVLYSWPAGSKGLLQGYTRDRESSEFTLTHFKKFIRALAACPDVEKINIIGHSRGTDVVLSAVRELHIASHAAGKDTRLELKLGQLILAAPDIDMDVAMEKAGGERAAFAPQQFTMYVSPNDKAIGLSTWLFNSAERLGKLNYGDLEPAVQQAVKQHPVLAVVDVRAKTDRTGHGYFLSSPAALSDVILVLRDNDRPGAANGRPLIDDPAGFWQLPDGYPFHDQAIKPTGN